MATAAEIKELEDQVALLQKKLSASETARTSAEKMAQAVAEASPFVGNTEEQATGKTVTINVCLNPWERDEKKQKFKDIQYPTYFYSIQLPTGAGLCLSTNGIEYYHGQTYEFDPMSLADMKSRVALCWKHEQSIHGENENAYRRPTNSSLISAAAKKH